MMNESTWVLVCSNGQSSQNAIDPMRFRKQVIYEGLHVKGADDAFEIDLELLTHWRDQGNLMLSEGIKIPMPVVDEFGRHIETKPELNRAYVESFELALDSVGRQSLYVLARFTDAEASKLLTRADVSLYSPKSRDLAGRKWVRPITHIAWTNQPVITGLEAGAMAMSCDLTCQGLSGRLFLPNATDEIDEYALSEAETHGQSWLYREDDGMINVTNELDPTRTPFMTFTAKG